MTASSVERNSQMKANLLIAAALDADQRSLAVGYPNHRHQPHAGMPLALIEINVDEASSVNFYE
jgi:hypothetical protein